MQEEDWAEARELGEVRISDIPEDKGATKTIDGDRTGTIGMGRDDVAQTGPKVT